MLLTGFVNARREQSVRVPKGGRALLPAGPFRWADKSFRTPNGGGSAPRPRGAEPPVDAAIGGARLINISNLGCIGKGDTPMVTSEDVASALYD